MYGHIRHLFIIVSFCLSGFFPSSGEADASEMLYLLLGTPSPKGNVAFPASLYKIGQKKNMLMKVCDLISAERGIEFIHEYPDRQVIILGEKNFPYQHMRFAVVRTNDPTRELSFQINFGGDYSPIKTPLFDVPARGVFQGLDLGRKGMYKLLGMNLSVMEKQEKLSWDTYKYVLASGSPGVITDTATRIYFHCKPDGRLVIPVIKHRIETDWRLPESVTFPKDDLISAPVNNRDMLAVTSVKSHISKSEGLGSAVFHIFDKKAGKWHTAKFQGCKSPVRGVGPWLAGHVADRYRGTDSPGREMRRQEMTPTGWPLDWDLENFGIYSPGILFLYNVHTRRQYTIHTNQGDSEILLIEGGSVYYRANRSVYKARIGRSRIGKGELLVRDDLVPDIHWAFIGP